MRPYAERRAARIARLEERAAAKKDEAAAAFRRADQIANVIPMGQPILVGHHSERRHRKDIARIDNGMRRGFEANKEAAELERRAAAAASNTAISSDDPEAIDKLREKLVKLEAERARYKKINAAIRTTKLRANKDGVAWEPLAIAALVELTITESLARDLVTPDFAGRIGIADYQMANIGAEVRRLERRIADLESRDARSCREPEVYGEIRVEESENRVRLYFPGKPAEAIRSRLKSAGFRWSPSEGAWQRMASEGAWFHARTIAKEASQ